MSVCRGSCRGWRGSGRGGGRWIVGFRHEEVLLTSLAIVTSFPRTDPTKKVEVGSLLELGFYVPQIRELGRTWANLYRRPDYRRRPTSRTGTRRTRRPTSVPVRDSQKKCTVVIATHTKDYFNILSITVNCKQVSKRQVFCKSIQSFLSLLL